MHSSLLQAATSPAVRALASDVSVCFTLKGDTWEATFTVEDNQLKTGGQPHFSLVAPDSTWDQLLAAQPPPGAHSLVHQVRTGAIEQTGDVLAYHRHVHIVRTIIDASRKEQSQTRLQRPLTARGEYHRLTTSLGTSDVYVERAGSGPPLLALATAGSDISQWHGLITNSDLTDRYELITVDLPWHGKTSPAWGAPVGSYRLTPETYTEFIVAITDILQLQKPTLVGVSMAGAAVVYTVATHPQRFQGAVACQVGQSVQSRKSELHRSTHLNPTLFVPEWTYGLMNPASPEEFKQRVWWGYSSGGYGLYAADIDSYSTWDYSQVERHLTPASPHIAVLSGVFDTSVPTTESYKLAQRIPNSSFAAMPELGHFPHAENPMVFSKYLELALQRISPDT